MISLDTETDLIAPGLQAPPLVCVSVCSPYVKEAWLYHWTEAEGVFESLLSGTLLVGHTIAYDMAVCAAQFPVLLPKIVDLYDQDGIEDIEIRQKLLDIAGGVYRGYARTDGEVIKLNYSLADLSKRHFKITLSKGEDTWRKRYSLLRHVPLRDWPEDARRYAIDDAIAPAEIWRVQEPNRRWLADQHRQARAAFWLRLMQCWGLRTDPVAVRAFADATRAEHARLARELVAAGLLRPDRVLKSGKNKGQVKAGARDTKAAMARIEEAFGFEPPLTDGGKPALDEDACKRSGDPVLMTYAAFSSAKKSMSTDIPLVCGVPNRINGKKRPQADVDREVEEHLRSGRHALIHAHFQELLETGRTSSSPNVQNLPRKPGVRECFVPRPGYVFAASDVKGLELRTWAQVCIELLGHSRMAEVLNAGGDPHVSMAASILETSYEDALARYKAGEDAADNARQTGKVGNFGIPGGLGAEAFVHFAALQYGVILTVEQAQWLKQEIWMNQWPEGPEYLALIGRMIDKPFPQIEQLYSGRFRGDISYTEACNSFFQGLGADAMKSAGWLLMKTCYLDRTSVLFGSRPVNFVHDEFILEVPEELGHECAQELGRLVREGAAPWLPDVPPETEEVLMRRWTKKAKPKWAEGRLVPWE